MLKLHRRAMLARTAALALTPALAAPAALPATADIWAPAPDPIFAAIEAHRAAMVAYDAAVDVSGNLPDDTPEHDAAQTITHDTSDTLDAAGVALIETPPATLPGLAAVLAHIAECMDHESTWRLPDRLEPAAEGEGFAASCDWEASPFARYALVFAAVQISRLANGRA